jgi:hypothetical protein
VPRLNGATAARAIFRAGFFLSSVLCRLFLEPCCVFVLYVLCCAACLLLCCVSWSCALEDVLCLVICARRLVRAFGLIQQLCLAYCCRLCVCVCARARSCMRACVVRALMLTQQLRLAFCCRLGACCVWVRVVCGCVFCMCVRDRVRVRVSDGCPSAALCSLVPRRRCREG